MAHISGLERSQLLLLLEAVDDYVGADKPVRFIDAFVDGLDLDKAGFVRVQPKATGRPGYAPGDLLKLYIYGYLNRVRSSRAANTPARPSPSNRGLRDAPIHEPEGRLLGQWRRREPVRFAQGRDPPSP